MPDSHRGGQWGGDGDEGENFQLSTFRKAFGNVSAVMILGDFDSH